jgi:hypothetical protein
MKTNCPNINDREYKALAAQVGSAKAHTIYDMNNGNPVSLNADGTPSSIYNTIKEQYGIERAIEVRTKMFTDNFQELEPISSHNTLSINDNGSVTLSNGMAVNLIGKGVKSKSIAEHMIRQEVIESGERLNNLFDAIERSLPGVAVIRETQASLRDTKHAGEKAFVDRKGLHFNVQSVSYDTPIHEITHPWLHYLEAHDKIKYDYLMNLVRDSISDNKELYDLIRRKYPELNKTQLEKEYAATIAGFIGAEEVRKFMYRNNKYITESESKKKAGYFSNMISEIWKAIKNMLSGIITRNGDVSSLSKVDFSKATLDDIFSSMAEDVLMGKGINGMGYSEMNGLIERYYTGEESESSRDLHEKLDKITMISNIVPFLINRSDYSIKTTEQQKKQDVETIINSKMYKTNDGSSIYWEFGKKFVYPANISPETLRERIREDIIDKRHTLMESFNDKMINIIQQYQKHGNKKKLEKIIEEVFQVKLGPSQLNSIANSLRLIGINQPISEIYTYTQLKDHKELSHLYNPALDGLNYIVLIHGRTDSQVDMSLIDFANGKMGWSETSLPDSMSSLASAFGYDAKDFNVSNRLSDIRKILVATTLAGINKGAAQKNQRIRIRKAGVVGNNNLHISTHMISNMDNMLKNAKKLFSLPEVQRYFDPTHPYSKYIAELVQDDNAFSGTSIMQSWQNILESYYMDNRVRLGLSEEYVNNILHNREVLEARQLELSRRSDKATNEEYKLINMLVLYNEHRIDINGSQMKDISRKFKDVTNPHNIKHDAVQMFSIEIERVKAIMITELNGFKDEFQKLLKASIESHGRTVTALSSNNPEKVFGHLFKKTDVFLEEDSKFGKKGQTVKLNMFNRIYSSQNIKEAKEAGLTDADIKLADYIIEKTVERYSMNIMHNLVKNGRNVEKSINDIKAEVREKLQNGRIPIVPMTRSEMMRKGRVFEAAKKNWDKISKGELMAGEQSEYDEINFAYNQQLDENEQLRQMGMENVSDKNIVRLLDAKAYEGQTANLEYTMNMFVHDSIRKIATDNHIVPMYDSIKTWIDIIKYEFNNNEESQKVVEEYLKDYYNRVVKRRNKDEGDKIDSLIRNGLNTFSFMSLGYRPYVWVKSAYYNMQSQALEAMAKSITSAVSSEESKTLNIPGVGDMAKANAVLLSDFSKIMKLGKKFSIINSSEMDAIESIFTTMADKHAFRTQLSQLGNYYSDMLARLVSMTAFMMKDGSYYAHIYNKETDTLSYDITKDERFYKDGNWINENAKIIFNDLKQSLIRDGLATEENIMVGYDYRDANTRFKWYADKYIIGSMDEYQKVLLGQTAIGALFTQFRNFMPDKIFNFVGSNRMTSYGAVREVYLNADNQVAVIRKQIETEGSIASLWYYLSDVYKVIKTKEMTLKELNENLSPIRRHNLAKEVSRAIMFTAIVGGLYLMVKAGLSDKDRDKMEFLMNELIPWQPAIDFTNNMIPMVNSMSEIWNIMIGKARFDRLLRFTGPIYDGIYLFELISDYDDLTLTSREIRKQKERTEEEQKRINEAISRKEKVKELYKEAGIMEE